VPKLAKGWARGTRALSPILFISDLHLTFERERINQTFFRFLGSAARSAGALYILGDLFDYWLGDDDLDDPFHRSVADRLRGLADSGCAVFFMHGNRDLLISNEFARAAGIRLLPDPALVDLFGIPTLLMHGDTLCTADRDYQLFRAHVHSASWQRETLAKPLAERRAMALKLRQRSETSKLAKPEQIMDVSPAAVEQAFIQYGCSHLIHGHTHRPARHEHLVAGKPCERWVLSDWYQHGEYLRTAATGWERVTLS
jgi:UDP-2,3-diacylglucosamine hydrolase